MKVSAPQPIRPARHSHSKQTNSATSASDVSSQNRAASSTLSHAQRRGSVRPLPFLSNPVSNGSSHYGEIESIPLRDKTDDESFIEAAPTPHPRPIFNQRAKAAPIELFYDLFFVANLTAFTSKHEMSTLGHVRSYIGFFSVLWFTWLQVSRLCVMLTLAHKV